MIDEELLSFTNIYEGLAFWEMEQPMDLGKSPQEQVNVITTQLKLRKCNDSFAHMYGFEEASEIKDFLMSDVWGKDNADVIQLVEFFVKKSFEVANFEISAVDKHGNTKWFLNFSRPIIAENELLGIWTTQVDVTRRKELELEVNKSKSQLEAVMNNSHDIILSVNAKYELLTINKAGQSAFEQTFGVQMEPGVKILEVIPDVLVPIWKERYDRALSGEHFSIEDEYKDDLIEMYFDLSFNPIVEDDKVTGVSVMSRNITDRKLNEIQLNDSKNKYKSLAQEKAQLLTSLREYTFHTSHILRSPICNILGVADLVLTHNMDRNELKEVVEMVKSESERLDQIVHEMNDRLNKD